MSESPNQNLRVMLNKVPEVTLAFWMTKIMSTTVGETGADYLAVHVGLGTAVTGGIMVGLLATALPSAISDAALRAVDLLVDGGAGQHRRHPNH